MEKRPLSRALEGGFIAIKNCVNTEKCVNKAKKLRFFLYYSFLTAVYYELKLYICRVNFTY